MKAGTDKLQRVATRGKSRRSIRLKYVDDSIPGLLRKKSGRGFCYLQPNGRLLRSSAVLVRIRSLAIPPAWIDVWICENPCGHLQATGRDARGRKQYIYHPRWREVRDEAKYGKLVEFANALPRIRRRVSTDLRCRGLPRQKVLATIVRLMERTLIRIGNEEYARTNGSFGLTTMRDRHVRLRGAHVTFEFRGKSGIKHEIELHAPVLSKIIKQCQDLPGQELFQYLDESGQTVDVTSSDVNDYLREIAGDGFTAKDFRTWAGTVLAAQFLKVVGDFASERDAKRNIVTAIEQVAKRLGNTKAVCRKCYIHPLVFAAYQNRSLPDSLVNLTVSKRPKTSPQLTKCEKAVLALLASKAH